MRDARFADAAWEWRAQQAFWRTHVQPLYADEDKNEGAGAGADAAAPMQEEGTHRPPAPSDAPMQDARPAARSGSTAGARPCISRALPGPCLHHLPLSSCAPGARSLH